MQQPHPSKDINLNPPQSSSIYYGWKIVAVAFFVDFIAVGFFFYSYGVFFKALAEEFGGSRLDVSIGITLVNIVSAVISPFLGKALDSYPIRSVMIFGTVTLSLGFFLLSLIATQWQLYFILATLIAFGSSAMGGLSTAKLVTNWFFTKQGRALGIATMGISLSGVAMPIISAWMIQQYGWRAGFTVFGAVTLLCVLPVVLRYVITSPAELKSKHQPSSGTAEATQTDNIISRQSGEHWSIKQALGNRNFWLVVVTFALLFCCNGATLTHMVPRVTDMGFSLTQAAPILSFAAAAGVIGKVIYGWITDYSNARIAIWIAIFCQFIGQFFLLNADSYGSLTVAAMIFGFGMGGMVPIHGSLVSSLFGQKGFGYIMGLMRPAMLPIMVSGIPLAGWIYDTTGNYDLAFEIFMILYVLAAIAVVFIDEEATR